MRTHIARLEYEISILERRLRILNEQLMDDSRSTFDSNELECEIRAVGHVLSQYLADVQDSHASSGQRPSNGAEGVAVCG